MAIASVGTLGTGTGIVAGTSTVITPTAQLDAGNIGILIYSADSNNNVDGVSTEVSSVTDSGSNQWSKLIEYNNNGDSSTTQVVVSVWFTKATGNVASGTGNITVNHNSHDGRAATAWEYTIGAGNTLQVAAGGSTTAETTAADAPSMSLSSLPSKEYLFFRAMAENLRTGTHTATATYTKLTVSTTDTGGGASSRQAKGEFLIATATGATSNPTTENATGMHAFVALEEITVSVPDTPIRIPTTVSIVP